LWHMPWKTLMALALVAILVLLGHLITMLTGSPFRGRAGF
jgi:hypothetical protein